MACAPATLGISQIARAFFGFVSVVTVAVAVAM
jgi:hypothetical protein